MTMEAYTSQVAGRDNAKAIDALEQTLDASAGLRSELLRNEESTRRMLGDLRSGVPFADAVQADGHTAVELRERVADPLDRYREARRTVRMAMIEDCLRSGLSRGRIAALLGVTRQRVTMLAKDLDFTEPPSADLRMLHHV
jgi:hypothetical protein